MKLDKYRQKREVLVINMPSEFLKNLEANFSISSKFAKWRKLGKNFISKAQHEKELSKLEDKMRTDWTEDVHRVVERHEKELKESIEDIKELKLELKHKEILIKQYKAQLKEKK